MFAHEVRTTYCLVIKGVYARAPDERTARLRADGLHFSLQAYFYYPQCTQKIGVADLSGGRLQGQHLSPGGSKAPLTELYPGTSKCWL